MSEENVIRAAIENTLNRYTLAVDDRDLAGVLDCFTENAPFSIRIAGGDLIGPFAGHAGIGTLMQESFASQQDLRRHVSTNLVVRRATSEAAEVETYLTLYSIDQGVLRLVATGRYRDRMVYQNGHWRIGNRHLDLDLPY